MINVKTELKQILLSRMKILYETMDGIIDSTERSFIYGAISELKSLWIEIFIEEAPVEEEVREYKSKLPTN